MSLGNSFSSEEILNWRKDQLLIGGNLETIDWLLDFGGGLHWSDLQKIKIFQEKKIHLDLSLQELSVIWSKYLQDKIPLQYLLGRCPWRDFELKINASALIPRQETELLIDIALSKIKPCNQKNGIWADLGTGSGPLAIGLARYLPEWSGHAVDYSKDALSLAKENIERLAPFAKVELHLGDWWEPLKPWFQKIDLVVANPPYIPTSELIELDSLVRDNEPHLALCGGSDGMNHSRKIIKGAIDALSSGGWLIFEHNYNQSERSLELLIEAGFEEVDFKRDLDGIKRFALGRKY